MFDKAKEKLNSLEQQLWRQSNNLGFGKWFLIRLIRVTYLVILKIPKERPMLRAAALTYTSTLSFLPVLAIVFGLLGLIDQSAKEKTIDKVFSQFESFIVTPVEPIVKKTELEDNDNKVENDVEQIKQQLLSEENAKRYKQIKKLKSQIIKQIDSVATGGKLSGISLILFFLGALTLLANIERAFNDIWGIAKLRPFKQRMMSYVFILVISSIVIALSLMIVGASNVDLQQISWLKDTALANFLQSGMDLVFTYAMTTAFFTVLYMVMPNVQVSFPSALAGGIVAGVFFESNKLIAVLLVGRFSAISVAYGSLALIPILLIACMIAWLIILLGAHVASAWSNVEGYRREFLSANRGKGYDETIALRLMLRIAEHFKKEGAATDYEKLGEEWALPNSKLRNILDKLVACGLLHHLGNTQTRYVPGRELNKISVVDILSAVRFGANGWLPIPEGNDAKRVNTLVAQIHEVEEQNLKEITLNKLIDN